MKKILLSLSLIFQSSCSLFGINSQEGPDYKVILTEDNFEIRQYAPYNIAQIQLPKENRNQSSDAFKILAGYIFGKNKSKDKLKMTSPVIENSSQKIQMTAPVNEYEDNEKYTMQFIMPKKYKLSELPTPLNKNIQIKKVDKALVAVIKYTWTNSQERKEKNKQRLLTWLNNQKSYEQVASSYYASYNPPWTIPFMRTNEVITPIREK